MKKITLIIIATLYIYNANAQTISTIAGNGTQGYSGDGAAATSAALYNPNGVCVDASGNVYIADAGNNRIRKITTSTGIISTIAGTATGGFSGDGGAATSAKLYTPEGVSVDAAGNVYIADMGNNRIRKVTASTGIINTIAGTAIPGYSGDGGAATSAQLNNPIGVTVDATGNVYIVDKSNYRIRKINFSTGIINTIAGNGTFGFSGDGAAATSAQLQGPRGVCVDASGNVYIADNSNNSIRKVNASTGFISTIAGIGTAGYAGDGGIAINAAMNTPSGVFVDASGNIYIADSYNNRIRKINASNGIINTIAGNGISGYFGDGALATNAKLYFPTAVSVDACGNVYIADETNNRIRKVDGTTTTISASSSTTFCQGGQVTLTALSTNSYLWSNSATTQSITVSTSGNYSVSVTDGNGCSATSLATTVVVNPLPSAPTGLVSQTFCNSATVANLSATGTAIQWYAASTGGPALATTTPLVNGTHYFASQTINSCESVTRFDVTATINSPVAPTGTASQTFCNSATVANLLATGTAIKWYAMSSGGTTLPTSTALVNGIHYFASQTVSSCESTTRFDITVTALPANTFSQTKIVCAGHSVTVGSTTHTNTGTFTDVLPSLVNGCDSTITTHLTVLPANSFSQTITKCAGQSTIVGTHTYTTGGTYTDILTSYQGCDSTVTTHLTVNTVDTAVSVSNATFTAHATSATYQWINCNGNTLITGATNQTYTVTANGSYAVIVTQNSCTDTSVCHNITTTDIAENSIADAINIYPNPFTSQTTISFGKEIKNGNIKIVDELGKVIKTIDFKGKQLIIEKGEIKTGTYFLQIKTEQGTLSKKLIIN